MRAESRVVVCCRLLRVYVAPPAYALVAFLSAPPAYAALPDVCLVAPSEARRGGTALPDFPPGMLPCHAPLRRCWFARRTTQLRAQGGPKPCAVVGNAGLWPRGHVPCALRTAGAGAPSCKLAAPGAPRAAPRPVLPAAEPAVSLRRLSHPSRVAVGPAPPALRAGCRPPVGSVRWARSGASRLPSPARLRVSPAVTALPPLHRPLRSRAATFVRWSAIFKT